MKPYYFGAFAQKLSKVTGQPLPELPNVMRGFWKEPIEEISAPPVSMAWFYHGSRCFYCGRKTTEPPQGIMPKRWPKRHTMRTHDHVVPRSKGGEGITVHACHTCNQAKKDSSLEEFRAWCAMMLNKSVEQMVFYGEKI